MGNVEKSESVKVQGVRKVRTVKAVEKSEKSERVKNNFAD